VYIGLRLRADSERSVAFWCVGGWGRVASLRRDSDRLVYSHLAASGNAEKSQEICSN